jgi:hypothetical protein
MSTPKNKPNSSGADPRELAREWADRPAISGSSSGEFTIALLNQICRAIWPGTGTDPRTIELMQRAARDALTGIGPRDTLEGMLSGQIIATHEAAMECYRRAALPGQTFEGRQASLSQASKLVRACAMLVETLDRHRGKGQQVVRVEHVHVNSGGRAIVGGVSHLGGADGREN